MPLVSSVAPLLVRLTPMRLFERTFRPVKPQQPASSLPAPESLYVSSPTALSAHVALRKTMASPSAKTSVALQASAWSRVLRDVWRVRERAMSYARQVPQRKRCGSVPALLKRPRSTKCSATAQTIRQNPASAGAACACFALC